MLTPEQLLNEINKLRKDYSDEPDEPTYQALHQTFLFLSYNVGQLKQYLADAAAREGSRIKD